MDGPYPCSGRLGCHGLPRLLHYVLGLSNGSLQNIVPSEIRQLCPSPGTEYLPMVQSMVLPYRDPSLLSYVFVCLFIFNPLFISLRIHGYLFYM